MLLQTGNCGIQLFHIYIYWFVAFKYTFSFACALCEKICCILWKYLYNQEKNKTEISAQVFGEVFWCFKFEDFVYSYLWYYQIFAIRAGILHVSDELRENDLLVSELIGKNFFAFPSLKISRNPFLKWETVFAVINGEFGAGTLNLAGSWNSVSQNCLLLFLWNSINIRPIFQPLKNCGDLRVKVSESSLLTERVCSLPSQILVLTRLHTILPKRVNNMLLSTLVQIQKFFLSRYSSGAE